MIVVIGSSRDGISVNTGHTGDKAQFSKRKFFGPNLGKTGPNLPQFAQIRGFIILTSLLHCFVTTTEQFQWRNHSHQRVAKFLELLKMDQWKGVLHEFFKSDVKSSDVSWNEDITSLQIKRKTRGFIKGLIQRQQRLRTIKTKLYWNITKFKKFHHCLPPKPK